MDLSTFVSAEQTCTTRASDNSKWDGELRKIVSIITDMIYAKALLSKRGGAFYPCTIGSSGICRFPF